MKLKLGSIFLSVFLMFSFASAFTVGDGSCDGVENSLYIYGFNETPDDWGYVQKLGDQNIDYNVEIVNASFNPLINGTALHFNATSTGNNGGILFDYSFQDHNNNKSLGFPITTIEFDLYNVSVYGMVDWADIYVVVRQNNWVEGTTIEYGFDGIPSYYDNGDHFHAILNSINHNTEARGYDCSKYWTSNGTQIENHVDWTCPYEIDNEFTSFYLAIHNNDDSDFGTDFVIDNLAVSQYENVFNSPADCMGKEGFPYVHGYVFQNQVEQGFTDAIWENGVPVAYYRCQTGLDNQFGLEECYDTDFIPNQVEYSDRSQLFSDYPEYSIVWYDVDGDGKKDYHTKAYTTFRSDILFLGDYDGCVDVHDLCQEVWYSETEPYADDGNPCNDGGWIYNKTAYNPVHSNKTPTYVCGDSDAYDNLETSDVVVKTDDSFEIEPFPYGNFGLGDFRFEWMPFRDYDTNWDSFHPNTTLFWEKRILDNETGLCGYFADLGITPCPYEDLGDYLYCNARWNIDEPFWIETSNLYQNNNTQTIQAFTNQSVWLDEIIGWSNYTWFNGSYFPSYLELWNATIPNYFQMSLCRYDVSDYLPYGSLSAGNPQRLKDGYSYNDYSFGVGCGLNNVEGLFAISIPLFNNLTLSKQDYYIVEEYPFKYVYKFVRELDPELEVSKYVSIQVPIDTNVSDWDKFRYYDSSGDDLSFTKEGSTYNLLEDVGEFHPTWTNSPENFTVEFLVCKDGMYYDELAEDCFDTPTYYAVLGGRNQGFLSALLGIGMIVMFAYVFTKKGGLEK